MTKRMEIEMEQEPNLFSTNQPEQQPDILDDASNEMRQNATEPVETPSERDAKRNFCRFSLGTTNDGQIRVQTNLERNIRAKNDSYGGMWGSGETIDIYDAEKNVLPAESIIELILNIKRNFVQTPYVKPLTFEKDFNGLSDIHWTNVDLELDSPVITIFEAVGINIADLQTKWQGITGREATTEEIQAVLDKFKIAELKDNMLTRIRYLDKLLVNSLDLTPWWKDKKEYKATSAVELHAAVDELINLHKTLIEINLRENDLSNGE